MHQNTLRAIAATLLPEATLERYERLTGGVSADVYRLDLKLRDGRAHRIVLRAHRAGHSGHPVDLEHALLQALHRAGVPVPEPLYVDASTAVIDQPFLLMSHVPGTSHIPPEQINQRIARMADALTHIHRLTTDDLPTLPSRTDPLPEVFAYLPDGEEWAALESHLRGMRDTDFDGAPRLCHGDFWPENVLWRDDAIAAVLDWEDAALGDPLSDVASCRVELRYKFGKAAMDTFTQAYARHHPVDAARLALWQVYVAAAAQRYMGHWGLEPSYEAHMRAEALASIREASAVLMAARA